MADKLHFDLVTPEALVVSEAVDIVTVPGTEGYFGVLAGHAPFMSTVKPGVIEVENGAERQRLFVYGGFADVTAAGLTILAEEATPVDRLDPARLDQAIKDAEEDIGLAETDDARAKAQEALAHLQAARDAVAA